MTTLPPLLAYERSVESSGYYQDESQRQAAERLQSCYEQLQQATSATQPVTGVYLWGPVGRGKTWLMDLFYQSLQLPARRQHFHHFMQWVHQRLFELTGTADPLAALAKELHQDIRVLCFDELFVNDIGDAIILGRLFEVMFEQGVVVVATSNQPPEQLYSDGFNRERFLPAIAALNRHMQVVKVDGGEDHRLHPGLPQQRYWVRQAGQAASSLSGVFDQLNAGKPFSTEPIWIGSRSIHVVQHSDTVVWCRYAELCEKPLAALDFIGLCDRFTAILLSEVPQLGAEPNGKPLARGTEDGVERVVAGDRQQLQLSRSDDGTRRFIALVDECYDRKIPLYIEAEVPLEALYTQGYLSFPFRRTLSRLKEMQLERFARGLAPVASIG
ncbi:cell division protein ZapE [Azomonas macrocytogenes]|uniref:Cell division protein ZapE n=1 Tax=Azomonas macrocytogenes TaxID=69962 RepID=A0A839T0Q8_AZOMA|nr:cell division protein ZapE [Azomonas macrocytogenes]MBB3103157.1 cell division protein ZapE [Azomonas macrocytogenes]